jgi:hypothetical protein
MKIYGVGIMVLAWQLLSGFGASAQVLWEEPRATTLTDWTWGPAGQASVPQPPFSFLREKLDGTNPKVEVRDAAGREWTVKFGSEVHSDTFAPRLISALGYAATPTYFVAEGFISGAHGLKRAKHFVSKDGRFLNARFKLREHTTGAHSEHPAWSWVENPFLGSRQLGGLKILIMLTSNWDTKDSRDEKDGSNTGIIHTAAPSSDPADWYAVTDWGASFGKTGGYFSRDRWDWGAYRAQTAHFVRLAPDGTLEWGFKGKHGQDIVAGVGLEDIRWLLRYLARITDEQLHAGLVGSGASEAVAHAFTESIRGRIVQLQRVADSSTLRQATR